MKPNPQIVTPNQLFAAMDALSKQISSLSASNQQLRQRLYELTASEQCRTLGRKLRHPVEFRSQFQEDILLYDLFDGKPDGFIIEVGAFDGYNLSVSYGLEAIGWDALLIEGLPDRAQQCRDRRPGARVVHAALSRPDAPSEAEFTIVDDHWGGMLSYLNTHNHHASMVAQQNHKVRKVRVPVTTLDAVLALGPERSIDAIVIDVEGGEMDLLRGFDLDRHKPRVIIMEDHIRDDSSAPAQHVSRHAFEFRGWIGDNRIFIHRSETALFQRLESLIV